MAVLTLEKDVRKEVREYLRKTGWYIFPIVAGMYSPKGLPDYIAMKQGTVLFLETKSPNGKQSSDQIVVGNNIINHGCYYIVIHSLDDLLDFFDKNRIENERQLNMVF